MVTYRVAGITAGFAAEVAGWRYPPPYDTYDLGDDAAHLLRPEYRYHVVWDRDLAVGYCCFGVDATVPGGDYSRAALDVGWGMHPDLMHQGRGRAFVAAIVTFAERTYAPSAMRVTIAEFNERSLHVAAASGFMVETGRFAGPEGMRFVVLERPGGVR
jgi:[ribosomal protein S18]-alanine N-acetyltransferase